MPNQQLADMIARKLRDGIVHPGNGKDVKPRPIVLPFKPSPGMSQEMSDLMNTTTQMLAEAIVHAIETEGDCEMIPRHEATTMRRAVGEGPPHPLALPVHCRCDETIPLVALSHPVNDRITIDGPALIRGLRNRAVECPHREQ